MLDGKKTFISLAILLLGAFGLGDVISHEEASNIVNLVLELIGGVGVLYGRIKAKVQY